MNPALLYLIKVTVCSALLTGYYFLALRNKVFHQWNRFYLLLAVLFSLIVPLFQFTLFHTPEQGNEAAIRMLNAVQTGQDELVVLSQGRAFSFETLLPYLYAIVSMVLALGLCASLFRIARIIRQHSVQEVHNIWFVLTEVRGTPFSFFRYIFWNKAIDINSASGTQIFKHELVHVRQQHTLDKILMQVVLILFWCNPFFWLIRFELRLIHEFIADKKSVGQQDASQLAALILQTAYPKQFAGIINPFFQHSIKRRLLMLTKIQNPHLSYFSRIAILPLVVVIGAAFAVKTSAIQSNGASFKGNEKFTVVIDAGHGGTDGGAFGSGLFEKEVTLALAQQIKALNTNPNLKIVLTRSSDAAVPLGDRVKYATAGNADLFVSLHMNADEPSSEKKSSGFEVRVQHDSSSFATRSRLLGSALMQSLGTLYKSASTLEKPAGNVYVLKAAQCPAVLLECGYITHEKDLAFMQQVTNQQAVARKILAGVERYLAAGNQITTRDTLPKGLSVKDIQEVNVLADKSIVVKLKDGSTHTSTEKQFRDAGLLDDASGIAVKVGKEGPGPARMRMSGSVSMVGLDTARRPILTLNGELYPFEALNSINPDQIAEVRVLKDKTAADTWGDKGKFGVIEVVLREGVAPPAKSGPFLPFKKTDHSFSSDSVHVTEDGDLILKRLWVDGGAEPTFTAVEIAPQFDGGPSAWASFLQKNINKNVTLQSGLRPGTYTVTLKFIVEKDGSISNVEAVSTTGKKLEAEAIRVMGQSPRWVPAVQNGRKVRAYTNQKVSFVVHPTYSVKLPWSRGC